MMQAPVPWSMVACRAMGSPCRVVAPTHELAEYGREIVLQLEQRWSRFDPSSEVSALNQVAGSLTIVSDITFELVSLAQRARVDTSGAFNPLMLDQLVALGYDRSWECLGPDLRPLLPTSSGVGTPIELLPEISAICLPAGSRFDPGGIGKGLAGDMVASALLLEGADSVQVELGGDVRVAGPGWTNGGWQVVVDDRDHGQPNPATITLREGAVATSSLVRRCWQRGGVDVHHLVDPKTGSSADTDLDAVTVVAPTLWWAEVMAKVALIGGAHLSRKMFALSGMTAVLVGRDAGCRYEVVSPGAVAA